ncbi:MAG: helix-turn-helix transcriptional regulator [Kiritimatiellia bacterium]|jgi:DNA-binding transcriptional regulator YiaG|nr:helix-turn-helix transcriptional regulator [Kiritimatiellia bacterium]
MNLNTVLTAAISKGAMRATRKPIAALRSDVADLKRQVAELKRILRAVQKGAQHESAETAAPETEMTRIRPTGPTVRGLRERLGLTQVELAKLVGVSGLTISKWEAVGGRITLRSRTLVALAGVKGMGKRQAKAALGNAAQP